METCSAFHAKPPIKSLARIRRTAFICHIQGDPLMKRCSVITALLCTCLLISVTAKDKDSRDFTAEPETISSDKKQMDEARAKARLRVTGNRIVNADGVRQVLNGVSTGDIEELSAKGKWNAVYFKKMSDWGARVTRIVVTPKSWSFGKREKTLENITHGVEWARQYGMYTIIDWHCIGSLKDNKYKKGYETTLMETLDFWAVISARFKNEPYAAFYEIFSEPVGLNDGLGSTMTWTEWRDIADKIITEIYAHNPGAIPLVGGLNWCYDLTDAGKNPLKSKGIAFTAHPYSLKGGDSGEADWQKKFGYLSDTYPVFVTEIGFEPFKGTYDGSPEYGINITGYLANKGIGWTAGYFSPTWAPTLVSGWDFSPSVPAGQFFKSALRNTPYAKSAPSTAPQKIDVLIQDFDAYPYISSGSDPDSSATIIIDTADKVNGYGSLKIETDNKDWIFIGCQRSALPVTDWSFAKGVAFWFKGSASGDKFRTVIIDNGGEQFSSPFIDDSADWKRIEIPFEKFTRHSWQIENAPDDGFTKTSIEGFQIVQKSESKLTWSVDYFGLYR